MAALIAVQKVHVLISSRAVHGHGHDVFPYYPICALLGEVLLLPTKGGVTSRLLLQAEERAKLRKRGTGGRKVEGDREGEGGRGLDHSEPTLSV